MGHSSLISNPTVIVPQIKDPSLIREKRMDLGEWELLPIDGLLDFGEEDCEKKVFLGKGRAADPTTVFTVDLDCFRCPSPSSRLSPPSQPVPVRNHQDPLTENDPCDRREAMEKTTALKTEEAANPDTMSQVFFKKMKENEFVDMKILESPQSGSRLIPSPVENLQFGDEPECSEPGRNRALDGEIVGEEVNRGGVSIWKWSLTGIGTLCSFGVAAATICAIFIVGSHQRDKQNHRNIRP